MPAIARITGTMVRPRLPRRTVRLRMTLLYGCLFLVSGAAVLGVTYLLVWHANSASGPGRPSGPVQIPGGAPAVPAVAGADAQQLTDVMHRFAISSGIALAAMSIVSIVLGWIVAGRMLRPLRTITATVRDISATSLDRRLALRGPDDELTELGGTFDALLHRLESSFQAQRQFVANASHELRTPLARQRALGQVALSDPEATVASLRAAHERILVAGAHQERLIEALLTLTRGQAGIDLREPFDLGRLTEDVVDARRAEASQRGVTFRPAISPALVSGHRELTERLVANLVDNALKYNMPGGSIELTVISVDGRATLTVSNTGPVVPPDAVDDLFQPFRRLGTNRLAHADGLGLGLPIVRAVADAHDANLTTTAGTDGGLTISVAFPSVIGRTRRTTEAAVPNTTRTG